MKDTMRSGTPIDSEVTGDPVEAHGYIVTPFARMRGRLGTSSDDRASGTYGWVAIRPMQMTVLDSAGQAQLVRLSDVQTQAVASMALVGLLVALVSLLIPVLARAGQKPS